MDDMGRAGSDELDRVLPGTAHRGLQGRVLSSSKRKRARMLLEGVQICRSQELSMELRTSVVGYPFLDRRTGGDAVVALRRAVPGTLPALGLEVGGGLMGIEVSRKQPESFVKDNFSFPNSTFFLPIIRLETPPLLHRHIEDDAYGRYWVSTGSQFPSYNTTISPATDDPCSIIAGRPKCPPWRCYPCPGYLDRGATTLGLAFSTPVNVVYCTILARSTTSTAISRIANAGIDGTMVQKNGDRTIPFPPEKAVLHISPLSSWIPTFTIANLDSSFDHAEAALAINVGQPVTSLHQHGVFRLATGYAVSFTSVPRTGMNPVYVFHSTVAQLTATTRTRLPPLQSPETHEPRSPSWWGFPDSTTPPIPERRWTSENFRLFSFFLRYHHTIPQYRNRDRHHHYQSRKISEKGRGNGIEARGLQLTLNPRYQADLYPTIKSTLVRSVPALLVKGEIWHNVAGVVIDHGATLRPPRQLCMSVDPVASSPQPGSFTKSMGRFTTPTPTAAPRQRPSAYRKGPDSTNRASTSSDFRLHNVPKIQRPRNRSSCPRHRHGLSASPNPVSALEPLTWKDNDLTDRLYDELIVQGPLCPLNRGLHLGLSTMAPGMGVPCGRPVLVQQGMTRESRLRSFAIEPKGLGIGVGEAGVDHVLYVLSGATLDLSDTYLEMPFPGKTILERRIPGKRQKPGVGEHGVRLLFGLGHEVPCLGGMESGGACAGVDPGVYEGGVAV
ncbi:uncharacterized protein BO96DRAFT_463531 [Aspergillus niger CBS 101883]|uniref:uncharacterized protein n=1 Tax=Aspergillus lacticoffeatus (strain CBS 101883) TaxID=1450533 RepID=UPI000D7FE7ED|nr:uncharacterized protein BO96DRAFT_463531 [Aspergillus niger CBS 101883]PYH60076.1 hypothetical protein BO96DRAFT_463531 [Aspergillus niger CBS 101883]